VSHVFNKDKIRVETRPRNFDIVGFETNNLQKLREAIFFLISMYVEWLAGNLSFLTITTDVLGYKKVS